jgi:hypothetical protein
MSNLSSALQQLRQEQKQAEQRVEKLRSAISVIEGLVGRNGSGANGAGPGRVISAAARRRMALAQKLRCVTCVAHVVSSSPPQSCGGSTDEMGEV